MKNLGGGIRELKLNFGPGYRIYYGIAGQQVVLLLMGGSKNGQDRDIKKAREFWNTYTAEIRNGEKKEK